MYFAVCTWRPVLSVLIGAVDLDFPCCEEYAAIASDHVRLTNRSF
jgi:hypothetical protein